MAVRLITNSINAVYNKKDTYQKVTLGDVGIQNVSRLIGAEN